MSSVCQCCEIDVQHGLECIGQGQKQVPTKRGLATQIVTMYDHLFLSEQLSQIANDLLDSVVVPGFGIGAKTRENKDLL